MEQYIVFKSNDEKMAIDIDCIERIIEYIDPKKIPEGSEYLLGVIQYNSQVIPIIDLTFRLYGKKMEKSLTTKTVIVRWQDKVIGLVVDDIMGIDNLENKDYEQTIDSFSVLKDYVSGFIKTKEDPEDITIVLDVDKIFDAEQTEELKSVAGEK